MTLTTTGSDTRVCEDATEVNTLTYREFAQEVTRLYLVEDDGEKQVVLLAAGHPEHYKRWCEEED